METFNRSYKDMHDLEARNRYFEGRTVWGDIAIAFSLGAIAVAIINALFI